MSVDIKHPETDTIEYLDFSTELPCNFPHHAALGSEDGPAEWLMSTYQTCCDVHDNFDLCNDCYKEMMNEKGYCQLCLADFPMLRDIIVSVVKIND